MALARRVGGFASNLRILMLARLNLRGSDRVRQKWTAASTKRVFASAPGTV